MQATGEPEKLNIAVPSLETCQTRADAEKNNQTKHPKQDKFQQALCNQNSMFSNIYNILSISFFRSFALVFF